MTEVEDKATAAYRPCRVELTSTADFWRLRVTTPDGDTGAFCRIDRLPSDWDLGGAPSWEQLQQDPDGVRTRVEGRLMAMLDVQLARWDDAFLSVGCTCLLALGIYGAGPSPDCRMHGEAAR